MTANDIIRDARVAHVRELKTALSEAKARLAKVEAERDAILAHFELALVALHDFEQMDGGGKRGDEGRNGNEEGTKCAVQIGAGGRLRIIDGWNAILRCRNVSKLTAEDISRLKADYLANLGIVKPPPADACGLHSLSPTSPASGANSPQPSTPNSQPSTLNPQPPTLIWIVFDGPDENSYRKGPHRVTYTGGTGPHRADRLILDYVHSVKLLGLDTSRITVETADKALAKRLTAFGAKVVASE